MADEHEPAPPQRPRPPRPGSTLEPRLSGDQAKAAWHRAIIERLAELKAQGWKPDPAMRPKTPLEEDFVRMKFLRVIVAARCRRCTKAKCRRRAGPCPKVTGLDAELAVLERDAAEERKRWEARNRGGAAK